ncbi:MAG TPA: DUF1801 domain-containing protein [Candidatus Thermoplasmatota archaeon]|nr:DUF1801 domain-containing protein [Candidatus Thermoplasmatota archaeon]
MPSKPATRGASARKPAKASAKKPVGKAPRKPARKSARQPARESPRTRVPADASGSATGRRPVLLSGGNPQVAKADGDAPVQAYIAAVPGWKRDVARRLDALITRAAPQARKAVKWNSPFYGVEGQGWFVSLHVFTNYVKVTFFMGTSLVPVPPGGTGKDARWIDVHEDDLDERQMVAWVKQAASIPGWGNA